MIPSGCVPECPGCRYRSLSGEESAARKQEWAERCLGELVKPRPLLAPVRRWAYRRKALLHAGKGEAGWELGLLRRRGWEAELVPIPDCPLHAPEVNAGFAALRALLPPEIPLAFAQASGGFFTLVLKCHEEERWRAWARKCERDLRAAGIEGLCLNWNPAAGRRAISSRHQERIFGPEFLMEDGLSYGALAFRQQIPEVEGAAHGAAEAFLAQAGLSLALDLYCGSGTTMAIWRRHGWETLGVELGGEACALAEKNAPGATVLRGKVEERLPQLETALAGRDFVLYTNPPRDGQGERVLEWELAKRPAHIAYLSCNMKSLAGELRELREAYELESVQPFDFFPQTDHVEALALLRRK